MLSKRLARAITNTSVVGSAVRAFALQAIRSGPNCYSIGLENDLPHFEETFEVMRGTKDPHPLAKFTFDYFPSASKVILEPGHMKVHVPEEDWSPVQDTFLSALEQEILSPLDVWDKLALLDPSDPSYPESVARLVVNEMVSPFLARDHGGCEFINIIWTDPDQKGLESPCDIQVRLLGDCQGCEHAKQTLEQIVRAGLILFFPKLGKVEDVKE